MAVPALPAPNARHVLVFCDQHSYCAHPHLVTSADGTWVAVFNQAPRRGFILHPPEEPLFRNVVIRSVDEGESWSAPEPVPDFQSAGMECAGLTPLPDGRLMLNQWRFEWLTTGQASRQQNRTDLLGSRQLLARWSSSSEHDTQDLDLEQAARLMPWVRGGGETLISFSDDFGRSFGRSVPIDTRPFSGGYGMRGGATLSNGTILLPLCDVPHYRRVFVIQSNDNGASWSAPRLVCTAPDLAFEEPAILQIASGQLILVMRENRTRHLHQITSDDEGESWSTPCSLGIEGYPPHLLALPDGRLLMTIGWRHPDFGIRAVFSYDNGETWATGETIAIRSGMPSRNLGYPVTMQRKDGAFFTLYYGESDQNVTGLHATIWR
ncbi:MAG: sialidase family protein [Proteobacteria bacterium]|jgi:hypothetical protein|nr:sialidase family protein [Pseudomonadota bacterium]